MSLTFTHRRRTIAAAAAVAVLGLTLTACGDDGDASSSGATTPAATSASASASASTEPTIVDLAAATPDLSTLVTLVKAADLAPTLSSEGTFTVFAPTNDAFAKLPTTVTEALTLPCNKKTLTEVLTYHVLPTEVKSSDIKAGDVATVQGEDVTLALDGSKVTVNGAEVAQADVTASNGVVHVINGVLLPPSLDVNALPTSC